MNTAHIHKLKQDLLNALLQIQDKPIDKSAGICYNVEKSMGYDSREDRFKTENILEGLFKSWPLFSGSIVYPVPDPDGFDPGCAFMEASDEDMWEGAYGNLRKELLQHCIDELQKELCNQ